MTLNYYWVCFTVVAFTGYALPFKTSRFYDYFTVNVDVEGFGCGVRGAGSEESYLKR